MTRDELADSIVGAIPFDTDQLEFPCPVCGSDALAVVAGGQAVFSCPGGCAATEIIAGVPGLQAYLARAENGRQDKGNSGVDRAPAQNGARRNQQEFTLEEPDEGIPFFITQAQKARLRELGYGDKAIAKMRPAEAQAILRDAPAEPLEEPEYVKPLDPAPPISDALLRRVPPQNVEAEQSFLGAILLEPALIQDARTIIARDDFYRESHREIYAAMLKLSNEEAGIDAVTLCHELRVAGLLDDVGGTGYIAELAAFVPTAAHIANYAAIIRECALKREIASRATQLAAAAYNGLPGQELISWAQSLVPDTSDRKTLPVLVKNKLEVMNWMDLQSIYQGDARQWVVEGLLARREISLWSGKVEAGKTTLMRTLVKAVLRGEPFLNRQTYQGRVFYAMLDADGADATVEAFRALGLEANDPIEFIFEPTIAMMKNGIEQFHQQLLAFKPALVVIDTLGRLQKVADFNGYESTYLMAMISELSKQTDSHLALLGHIPRGRHDDEDVATAAFGSIAFSGGANARFVVSRKPASGLHTLRSSKGKGAGFVPLEGEILLERDGFTGEIHSGGLYTYKEQAMASKDKLLEFLDNHEDEQFSGHQLGRELGVPASICRVAGNSLFAEQRIKREGQGTKGKPYLYAALTFQNTGNSSNDGNTGMDDSE
jgi:DnaB helicase-like protein/AAA domain-containing protein